VYSQDYDINLFDDEIRAREIILVGPEGLAIDRKVYRERWEDKIIKLRDRYEALFRKAVAACVAQRVFRDMNVKITTLALLGMMNWLIHWYAPDGPMNTAEIARIFSDLFLKRPRR
jgi:hypothetical protein